MKIRQKCLIHLLWNKIGPWVAIIVLATSSVVLVVVVVAVNVISKQTTIIYAQDLFHES